MLMRRLATKGTAEYFSFIRGRNLEMNWLTERKIMTKISTESIS